MPVALTGDVYRFAPRGWRQAFCLTLVPQLLVWPVFTVLAGWVGAKIAALLAGRRVTDHLRERVGHASE